MERIKKILKKIFCLPLVLTLLISIPSYALVIYVLSGGVRYPFISYFAYVLSAYSLIITITKISSIIKSVGKGITQCPLARKLLAVPLINRFIREVSFRTEASLYQGLFINLIYIGIKLFSGIYYCSIWFVTLSVYYLLLAVMRFSLLLYVRKARGFGKDKTSEWRRYRFCGIILLFMNQVLAGIIVLVVQQNSGFEYPGLFIYAMALYAFYATITAVMNVIKFKKYGSPILSAAKAINLTAALVSMLSLEIAMLTQFGAAEDARFRRVMTSCTGAQVAVIVLGMAVYMIINATKNLNREIKKEEEN